MLVMLLTSCTHWQADIQTFRSKRTRLEADRKRAQTALNAVVDAVRKIDEEHKAEAGKLQDERSALQVCFASLRFLFAVVVSENVLLYRRNSTACVPAREWPGLQLLPTPPCPLSRRPKNWTACGSELPVANLQ